MDNEVEQPPAGGKGGAAAPERTTAQRATHHALLFSPRSSTESVRLLCESVEPHDIRFDAEFLGTDAELGLSVLEVRPLGMLPVPTPLKLEIVRGRRGGKAGEAIYVLQPVHLRSSDMRSTQRSGFAKAVLRAVAAICPDGRISLPLGWLAVGLAAQGYCSRSDLARTCRRIGEPMPDTPPGTLQCPGYIVLSEWAEQQALAVAAKAQKAAQRNPFFTKIDNWHVRQWCGGCDLAVAAVILHRLAYSLGIEPKADSLGEAVSPGLETRPLSGHEDERAKTILERYTSGQGLKREYLERDLPSSLNIVGWLFESHLLVESASGYVMARASLDEAHARLGSRVGGTNPPGVGEIKDKLGWPRQMAEGYRNLLESGLQTDLGEAGARPQQPRTAPVFHSRPDRRPGSDRRARGR